MTDVFEGCPEFIKTTFPLGCPSSQSWGIIAFFCVFGLTLFTIQYRRKKDKIVLANLIYFAVLLTISLIGIFLTGKFMKNGSSSLVKPTESLPKIVDAGIKILALLFLIILLVRQDTLREVGEDFTNTILGKKNDENKNRIN